MRAGFWSSTRDLDSEEHLGAGLVWLKAARPITNRVSFLVEGLVALRGPMDDGDVTGELREAYVDVRLGRLDLRLGRQIVAWGRADGVNPTDNLTGDDVTLLVPDEGRPQTRRDRGSRQLLRRRWSQSPHSGYRSSASTGFRSRHRRRG